MFAAVDVSWIGSQFILLRGKKGRVKSSFPTQPSIYALSLKQGMKKVTVVALLSVHLTAFVCVCVCVCEHTCVIQETITITGAAASRQAAQRMRKVFWPDRETGRKSQSSFLLFLFYFFSRNGTSAADRNHTPKANKRAQKAQTKEKAAVSVVKTKPRHDTMRSFVGSLKTVKKENERRKEGDN